MKQQLELDANTRQARETDSCAQVTIGLDIASDWLKKWCEQFEPITIVIKQKQSKRELLSFSSQLKTALSASASTRIRKRTLFYP